MRYLASLIKDNIGFILFIFVLFATRSSIADWYHVPSGSMLPTIIEGDRVLVDKMAYRLDVPFTDIVIMQRNKPQRGDIVTFESSKADNRLIKRVIGVPGDEIAMVNNQLFINGKAVTYRQQGDILIEELSDPPHAIQLTKVTSGMDNFALVTVPEGHYLVLGDNRNHSADSRVYGFIPETEITGKATRVITSLDLDNYYIPRKDRWFEEII
ncbi:signal peptidase I [Alteromonas sp. ASW11-36]|uniref:Signal peptidase I n=1 Tax=Alteromonas arenosi TaxID=3055817 RepID=A0ABT7SVN5_9ALTE|nr:signal peptidase I [Alteromonas sp. ASW11-36]MDM7860257.1 signal peptidase I [Alteromonas sp. ASW11-36]